VTTGYGAVVGGSDVVRATLRSLLEGPVSPMLRRFVVVGTAAAAIQMVLLATLVEVAGVGYLLAAALAIETTIVLQYFANNAWTFRQWGHTTLWGYATGLARTNLVRGSAIPIQLGVLWALVSFAGVMYLVGNAVAIGVSGIYRYLLDSRWTWKG
jgi:putative flippase GtrA